MSKPSPCCFWRKSPRVHLLLHFCLKRAQRKQSDNKKYLMRQSSNIFSEQWEPRSCDIYLDSVLANPSLPWHLEFQNDGKAKKDCSVSILALSPGTSPSWGTSLSRALATCPWPSVSTSLGASCLCNRSWRSPVGCGTWIVTESLVNTNAISSSTAGEIIPVPARCRFWQVSWPT